jgi:heme O synthase-like polyprenyltransferase
MFNAQKFLGVVEDNFRMPLAMLLLFVLSASVVSALILGKPILLYLEDKKAEGIKMFLYSVGWLFIFAVLAFASILL